MCKASVIIPVYNVEKYLMQCVDSVLGQSYQNVEVILVDDGSTDSSGKLCDDISLLDNRVVVYHKVNGGLSSARNYGLLRCSGEYVIFLDSDDFWLSSTCLEEMVDVMRENDVDVVRGCYQAVDEDGKFLYKGKKHSTDLIGCKLNPFPFVSECIKGEFFICLFLFRRNSINILFDENRRFQEDIDFVVRYYIENHISVLIASEFYAYRQRSNSLTASCDVGKLKGSLSLIDVVLNSAEKVTNASLQKYYRWYSQMMYYWTMESLVMSSIPISNVSAELNLNGIRKEIVRKSSLFSIYSKGVLLAFFPLKLASFYLRITISISHFLHFFVDIIRKLRRKISI